MHEGRINLRLKKNWIGGRMKRKDQWSTSILSRTIFGSLPLLLLASTTFGLTIDVADSPTSNLALTLKTINSAKKTLYMNAYELTSPEITDALVTQIKNGIKLELIQEGEPCCAKVMSAEGKKMQKKS